MTNPRDLMQLYILLSYEKLQRAVVSQRHRPVEGSLRNRLLVWRFLKQIENEPLPASNPEPELFIPDNAICNNLDDNNNDPWILNLNPNYDEDNAIDMDIESDFFSTVENNNNFTYDTMNIDQTSDMPVFFKRAIGAERRQKSSTDNFYSNDSNYSNSQHVSETNSFEESEQFFHDLCAELTNTTATLVSSTPTTNTFNFPSVPEQTLIH